MSTELYPGIAFSPQAALADNIGAADTIVKVTDVSAFPDAPNLATIGTDEEGETILYAAKTADALSGCVRGVEGTARSWNAGEVIGRNWTAKDHKDLIAAVLESRSASAAAQTAAESATRAASAATEALSTKQDKLTGTPGQVVGFSADGSAAAVQGWSNHNLLDNWYFASPINQRGVSGTITASGYFIDRWRLTSGTVELTSSGLVLNGTITQVLETAPSGAVTASARTTSGIVTPTYNISSKTFSITGTGQTFVAAKLEPGDRQTLAYKDTNGNWVLNDPPPNKALELAKCQRYMNKFDYIPRLLCYIPGYLEGFSFPQMRATPTVSCNVILPGHADSPLSATPAARPDGVDYIHVPEATVGTWYILMNTLLDANL